MQIVNTVLTQSSQATPCLPKHSFAKKALLNKDVIKWVLKDVVADVQDLTLEEIRPLIGEIQDNSIALYQGLSDGTASTETSLPEEEIGYDIRFALHVGRGENPGRNPIDVIIKIAFPQSCAPDYPLEQRAFFHASEVISEQDESELLRSNFSTMRKLYSFWLFSDPQKYVKPNHIRIFRHRCYDLAGEVEFEHDGLNIVFIAMGKGEDNVQKKSLALLNLIFSNKSDEEKMKLLSQDPWNITLAEEKK